MLKFTPVKISSPAGASIGGWGNAARGHVLSGSHGQGTHVPACRGSLGYRRALEGGSGRHDCPRALNSGSGSQGLLVAGSAMITHKIYF